MLCQALPSWTVITLLSCCYSHQVVMSRDVRPWISHLPPSLLLSVPSPHQGQKSLGGSSLSPLLGSPVLSIPNESSPLPEYLCLCTRTLVAGHMTRSLPLQGLLHRHLVLLSATNRMKHILSKPCLNSGGHPSEAWYHNVNRCARLVVWDPPSSFPRSDAVLAGCHQPGESSCINLLVFLSL